MREDVSEREGRFGRIKVVPRYYRILYILFSVEEDVWVEIDNPLGGMDENSLRCPAPRLEMVKGGMTIGCREMFRPTFQSSARLRLTLSIHPYTFPPSLNSSDFCA